MNRCPMLKTSDDRNATEDWKGLKEIDRAIAENRLMEYRVKKTWADPWGRAKLITVFALLAAFLIYLIVDELIL